MRKIISKILVDFNKNAYVFPEFEQLKSNYKNFDVPFV